MSETHAWTDRLSDYIDGDVTASERADMEAHLVECSACRGVLEELRAVVVRARAAPESLPARDLWPGIAAAIDAPVALGRAATGVIALPGAEGPVPARRRLVLTAPQLAAAAVALVIVSSLSTWAAAAALARGGPAEPEARGAAIFSVDVPSAPTGLAEELESLEEALARSSAGLDADTRRIIQKNLAVIERAIDESRRALVVDPGNAFLESHLDRAYRRKLTYLREAAQLASWTG
jgi:hypothetical protein